MSLSLIEKTNVKDVYEEIADHFKVTRVYTWSWIKIFISKLKNNSIIYDIGCGNGRNMDFENQTFIGIDNCKKFVDMCLNDKKLAILANMTNINLPSNSADAIICIASFHHLSNRENRIKALYEMKRLIKPECQILLSVWSINQPKKTKIVFNSYGNQMVTWNHKYKRFYYIFRVEEIKTLFIECGLIIIDHKYDCGNEIFILKKK
jgi:alkylated DNA repair protein alkB family protein 8|tara:strand:- start:24 stop:641 length:618 start_codon:yes stop_codon:yes gene_type:complete